MNKIKWILRLIYSKRFTTWRKVVVLFGLANDGMKIIESGEGQYIYRLIDPVSLSTFYVGRSNNPGRRYVEHINEIAQTDKAKRIKQIKRRLHLPYMVILEQCSNENVKQREKYWIAKFGGKNRLENMKE